MATLICLTGRKKHVRYEVAFDDLEHPGCGFSFPSNRNGRITLLQWLKMHPHARKNLALCKANPAQYEKRVIR